MFEETFLYQWNQNITDFLGQFHVEYKHKNVQILSI